MAIRIIETNDYILAGYLLGVATRAPEGSDDRKFLLKVYNRFCDALEINYKVVDEDDVKPQKTGFTAS